MSKALLHLFSDELPKREVNANTITAKKINRMVRELNKTLDTLKATADTAIFKEKEVYLLFGIEHEEAKENREVKED